MALIVFIVLLISCVSAFGVSSSYWKGNPLKISPGETRTATLYLQNMVGGEDITVKAVLLKGKEIASVEEKNYLVRAGTKDTEVPVKVSVPSDSDFGGEYQVTVGFNTITPGQEGTVSMGVGIENSFDILIVPMAPVEEQKEPQLGPSEIGSGKKLVIALGILILVVLVIIIYPIVKKRKR